MRADSADLRVRSSGVLPSTSYRSEYCFAMRACHVCLHAPCLQSSTSRILGCLSDDNVLIDMSAWTCQGLRIFTASTWLKKRHKSSHGDYNTRGVSAVTRQIFPRSHVEPPNWTATRGPKPRTDPEIGPIRMPASPHPRRRKGIIGMAVSGLTLG